MSAGVIALVVVLVVATAFGLAWQRRQGRLRAVGPAQRPGSPGSAGITAGGAARPMLTAADLGHELGPRATLVQFSSAFCAPCRATRQILGEVAGLLEGVDHVEIDAESRLDLVRRLNILSTPTVLLLGPGGVIARQASGQPRKADVITALGELVTPTGSADGPATAAARD